MSDEASSDPATFREQLAEARAKNQPPPVPKGWEPYAEESGRVGSAIVRLPRPGATERDLLIGAGFDPDCWRIYGPVNTRRWMRYDQEWLFYYKFDVVQGESPEQVEIHVKDLVRHLRRRKPRTALELGLSGGGDAWLYDASDWQVGKREGEDGSAQTVDRVAESVELAVRRVKDLRRCGALMPQGAFVGLGDLGEGTCGFYPNQPFLIDLNRRDQNRVVRELITYAIDELSPLFEVFEVATVGGNHGENRDDGKKATDDGDNDDVAQFEAVKEAYDRAGRDPHIRWHIPRDELSIALELGGVLNGFTHGHLFRKGSTVQAKAHEWWKGQDFGFQAVRGTQILHSAHFHHLSCVCYGSRTHWQTPPMDPGSKWFRETSGEETPAGALTMRISAEEPLGFSDVQVLGRQHRR